MRRDFIGDSIFDFQKLLKKRIEKEFQDINIGMGQLQVLMRLYEQDTIIPQSFIVSTLGVDKSNASRNIKKLVEKGLVQVVQMNGKEKGIVLSNEGNSHKGIIMSKLQSINTNLMDGISKEEIAVVSSVIHRMKENLI